MPGKDIKSSQARATLGIKLSTKSRLDRYRAPGQCYDGFICQMLELWEEANAGRTVRDHRASGESNI